MPRKGRKLCRQKNDKNCERLLRRRSFLHDSDAHGTHGFGQDKTEVEMKVGVFLALLSSRSDCFLSFLSTSLDFLSLSFHFISFPSFRVAVSCHIDRGRRCSVHGSRGLWGIRVPPEPTNPPQIANVPHIQTVATFCLLSSFSILFCSQSFPPPGPDPASAMWSHGRMRSCDPHAANVIGKILPKFCFGFLWGKSRENQGKSCFL